mmetsp:Transcript_14802/g.21837  ORF Transcript_14802/g.21837 Transcript_14802/m.21837 type:complete len:406 (-) Transcript_14802:1510-2727(-)
MENTTHLYGEKMISSLPRNNNVFMGNIRKRIRSRFHMNRPFRCLIVYLLVFLVGFEAKSSPIVSLAVASELSDDSQSSSRENFQSKTVMQRNQNSTSEGEPMKINEIFIKAGKRGLGGGIAGGIAGVVQVLSLMWIRTIINYQCRYGTSFFQAMSILMNDGGISRFYRGLSFALVQAPLARFVSAAANDGVELFFARLEKTKDWGPGRTTVVAGLVVGIWRMFLMPIDTCKTVLQVDSVEGFRNLIRRVKAGNIGVLYQGMFANALSSFVGHFPWFFTYNKLSKSKQLKSWIQSQLLRNAAIGLISSMISDVTVNVFRVVKTTKQAIGPKRNFGYSETVRMILAADGWKGLFGRGLRTRIFANALQSIIFTVIWRGLAEGWKKKSMNEGEDSTESEHQESDTAAE